MSAPLFHATLNPQSPRYEDWLHVLGGDSVPLKSQRIARASLGDEETNVEVYELDIYALTSEQRARLVSFVAEKFGVAPAKIEEQLSTIGFPVRIADVFVATSMRAFL